jgi:hypothetical protein
MQFLRRTRRQADRQLKLAVLCHLDSRQLFRPLAEMATSRNWPRRTTQRWGQRLFCQSRGYGWRISGKKDAG